MTKNKSTRVRKWSPERPLVVTGRVVEVSERPGRWARLAGPLAAVARHVPAARATREGARFRRGWKVAFGAGAFALAAMAREDMGFVLPSLGALAMAVSLPVSDVTRARWVRRAEGLARGQAVVGDGPAEVTYDGTRVMVRCEGRQFSVRPAEAAIASGHDATGSWLALAPSGAGKVAVGFRCDGVRQGAARPCPAPADRVVTVAAEGWALLSATFLGA